MPAFASSLLTSILSPTAKSTIVCELLGLLNWNVSLPDRRSSVSAPANR
jgi:hypothetical protein